MPNYRRLYVPGGIYFFTLTLRDRRADTLVDHFGALLESWQEVVKSWPFETIATVVLPDHLHTVLRLPEGDDRYPTRLRLIKQGFTRRLPESLKTKGRKGERGVWQQRYWEHVVRNDKDLESHVNYIHFNPVKHGYVADVDEWPFSTWHRYKTHSDIDSLGLTIDINVGER